MGLCLYYHLVQFLRDLLSDCVFAFSPGNIGTVPILVFMSMAVSDFECRDSMRTLRLLQVVNIVISVEILLQRQKHSPWLVRHSRSSTSQLLQHWLEPKWFWAINHRPPPPDRSAPKFHKMCQGLLVKAVSQRGFIHTFSVHKYNYNYCIRW